MTFTTEAQFHDDLEALGVLHPDVEPRATEHIAEMRVLIERLVASGHAYVAEDHVLFSVPSMPDYGQLSRRPLEDMIAGARVDVAPYKQDAMDFVLWKPSKPGEPGWPSPAGIAVPGRPGWHIECSAMSWRHLGETFDIHGGGIDLVFPHHENEVAQSRCAFHANIMAKVWMHNGFLQVEGEKMSKSLGNFVTIRELLADWPGEVLRLNMLKTHYRQPIDWTVKGLEESAKTLEQWFDAAAAGRLSASRLGGAGGAGRRPQHAQGHRRDACAEGPCRQEGAGRHAFLPRLRARSVPRMGGRAGAGADHPRRPRSRRASPSASRRGATATGPPPTASATS